MICDSFCRMPTMNELMKFEIDRAINEVRLTGAFLFMPQVCQHMIGRSERGDAESSCIINISSLTDKSRIIFGSLVQERAMQ